MPHKPGYMKYQGLFRDTLSIIKIRDMKDVKMNENEMTNKVRRQSLAKSKSECRPSLLGSTESNEAECNAAEQFSRTIQQSHVSEQCSRAR